MKNWKIALTTPVPKNNDPSNVSDLRPISVIFFIILEILGRYLQDNGKNNGAATTFKFTS